MKRMILAMALLLSATAMADSIEDREQNYEARQQAARDAADARAMQNAKSKEMRQVYSFIKAHGGATSDPVCTVQLVGTEVGADSKVSLSACGDANVLWVEVCVAYLRNGDDCNIVPNRYGSHAGAGCYDRKSNYHDYK